MDMCYKCKCNIPTFETNVGKNDVDLCNKCYVKEKEDIINKPNHYHGGIGIDPIAMGESILTEEEMNGFYKMNMIKYWYRAGKKDGNSKEQDLSKYEFYRKKLKGE